MTAELRDGEHLRIFLAGDVMLGRGIDQILEHPSDPILHEPAMTSAEGYVRLAERKCGELPRHVTAEYVWGDLLPDLEDLGVDLRLINLETAVTLSRSPEPKGINYRMHPANMPVLEALSADVCVLANNHVLDWGVDGLVETLDVLQSAGIQTVGAGHNAEEAAAPRIVSLGPDRRVIVLAFGSEDSGIPASWAADDEGPGVNLLPSRVEDTVSEVRRQLASVRRDRDIVVVSIHWGGNWGYTVPKWQQALAHALVDECGIQIIFGHSSHHPKALEMWKGGLILYGAGDLINDYEGIGGHEEYRSDLVFGYLAEFGADGVLSSLRLLPYRIASFRLQRANGEERAWLAARIKKECAAFGCHIERTPDSLLALSTTSPATEHPVA